MGVSDNDLDTLAPEGYMSMSKKKEHTTTGYAWAIFYVIILTLIFLYALYALGNSSGDHGGKKRPKVDKPSHSGNLLVAFVAAVVVVIAVSYFRRRK